MAKEKVTISVADEYKDRFSDIVQQCEAAGLEVEQALPTIGVVSGAIDSDRFDDFSKMEGVAAIERERTYQIPPPDSDIQ
ncbi:MAG: ketohydroxyglutarate aldolase [Chloroflexota bacterium]|nr:ketohydroxyglutarate aldolase [Chloroflexota bacterium]